jgi:hypothetical protein
MLVGRGVGVGFAATVVAVATGALVVAGGMKGVGDAGLTALFDALDESEHAIDARMSKANTTRIMGYLRLNNTYS